MAGTGEVKHVGGRGWSCSVPQRVLHLKPGGPGSPALAADLRAECWAWAPSAQSLGLVDTDLFFCVPEMTSGLQHRALSPAYNSSHPLHPQGERKGPSFPGEQALGWPVDKGGICS